MGKKEDDHKKPATKEEVIPEPSQVLGLKVVHNYTDQHVARGRAEYNKGSILVKSKHPLDQCLRRALIEEEHYEIGKRIRNYRDCAVSKLSGRTYNAAGEGDSEMDAGTIYARAVREMHSNVAKRRQWKLVEIVCFAEPNIDGDYLNEADYGALFKLAPNIRYAFECADEVITIVRQALRQKLDGLKKNQ